MQNQLQLTFRDFHSTPAITEFVEKRAAKLDTFFRRITSCHVAIEAPHQRRTHGRQYRVRVDVTVPGAVLVAGDRSADDVRHEGVYAAIDDAFADAQRLLREYNRKHAGARRFSPIPAR